MTASHSEGSRQSTTPLLTSEEVAEIFRVTAKTLSAWRSAGRGPRFVQLDGAIRYRLRDVMAFIGEKTEAPGSSSDISPEKVKSGKKRRHRDRNAEKLRGDAVSTKMLHGRDKVDHRRRNEARMVSKSTLKSSKGKNGSSTRPIQR